MINIAQGELQQLVCHNTGRIAEAKQRVVRKDSP